MTNATISNQRIGSWANSFEVYRSLLDECFLQQIPRYTLQKGLLHFIKQYTSHLCHLPLEIFKWIFIFYDKSLLLTKIKVLKRYHLKTAILRHLFFTQEVEKEFKRRLCSRHNFCIGYGLVYFVYFYFLLFHEMAGSGPAMEKDLFHRPSLLS